MAQPELPTVPPVENTTPRPSAVPSDQWIMKGLNDLRDDVRGVRQDISALDERVGEIERKVLRAVYAVGGAVALFAVLWAAFQFVTNYVDIRIVPKTDDTVQR